MQLELKSVSFKYLPSTPYSADALHNINVKIGSGEFVGIMGETGSGKTTLIQLMAGLLDDYSGTVLLDGQDISGRDYDRRMIRRKIGIVFQFPDYQLFETTVERDVSFALKNAGLDKSEIKIRVQSALSAVGFDYEKVKNKSPLSFSGGEKRRLAIAGILAADPEIFIFDEPIAGLDYSGRKLFLKLVSALNRKGKTIIVVSHNAEFLAEYAQRLLVMKNGRILKDGETAEILADYNFLKKNGIYAGQLLEISHMLKDKGIDISENTVKYNQFLDEVCRVYGRKD